MQPNGKFKVLNLNPYLLISNYDLEAIRAIVKIAPQEAQWYHTIKRVENASQVYYRISGLYIPEQYTSAAEVESDSDMMIKFYKELLKEHGNEKTNEIMQHLTCWCHSHHNMGVGPSGQDRKQFTTQCENSIKDNVKNPQVMMIFNKKDQYYCQVFDPKYNLIFENIPMYEEEYDFSWIKHEAKLKFKKKVLPKKKAKGYPWSKSKTKSKSVIDWGWGSSYLNETASYLEDYSSTEEAEEKSSLKSFMERNAHSGNIPSQIDTALDKLEKSDTAMDVEKLVSAISKNFDPTQIKMLNYLLMYDLMDDGSPILSILDQKNIDHDEKVGELLIGIDDTINSNGLEFTSVKAAVFVASIAPNSLDVIDLLESYDDYIQQRNLGYTLGGLS